jgi:hypothetical protein
MKRRDNILMAVGLACGFLIGVLVTGAADTQAAPRNQYKVERLDGSMQVGDPTALQDMLDQRAAEGWSLQALDHGTVVFRKAAAAKPAPTPSPEP